MINQLPKTLIQSSQTRQKSLTWCPEVQDRFIPNRRNTVTTDYMLNPNFKLPENYIEEETEEKEQNYEKILKNNLLFQEQNKQHNILEFSSKQKVKKAQNSKFSLEKRQKTRKFLQKAQEIIEIPGFEDNFYYNNMSLSSKNQIAIVLANKLYIFDRNNHNVIELYEAYDCEAISSIQWNPEGNLLSIGNELGEVQIWDVEKQTEIQTFENHQQRVGCIDWKDYLISGSKDRKIFMHDLRLEDPIVQKFTSHQSEICSIKWSNDQKYFSSGASDGKMYVWSVQNQKPFMKGNHDGTIRAMDWSHFQNGLLFSGGGLDDQKLKVWNIKTQELVQERKTGSQICSIVASKESNDIFSAQGHPNYHIDIWRAKGLKRITSLIGHKERVLNLQISHTTQQLLSVSSDETLRLWDISREKCRKKEKLNSTLNLDMPSILRQNNCYFL